MSETNSSNYLRGSSLLLLGRIASVLLNFGAHVLAVNYLTKGDYGAFAYALMIASLGSSICLFGLNKTVRRFLPIYQEKGNHPAFFGTLLLSIGITLGIGGSCVLFTYGFQGLLSQQLASDPLILPLLLIIIFLAPLNALDHLFQSLFAVLCNPWAIFVRRHLLGPGLKLLAVCLVMMSHGNVLQLALGYLIGGVIGLFSYCLMFAKVLRDGTLTLPRKLNEITFPTEKILKFTSVIALSDLTLIAKSELLIIFLLYFHDATAVAEFRVAVPVAGLNLLVLHSFGFLFTPAASRLYAKKDMKGLNDHYWKSAVWVSLISLPLFLATFFFADTITLILFKERYAQSAVILSILSLGSYLSVLMGMNGAMLQVHGRKKYIVFASTLTAFFSIGTSLVLIPLYGPMGAATSASGTLLFYSLLNHLGLHLTTEVQIFPKKEWKVYASVVGGVLILFLFRQLVTASLPLNIALSICLYLLIIRINRVRLNLLAEFPALMRIPLVRNLVS